MTEVLKFIQLTDAEYQDGIRELMLYLRKNGHIFTLTTDSQGVVVRFKNMREAKPDEL